MNQGTRTALLVIPAATLTVMAGSIIGPVVNQVREALAIDQSLAGLVITMHGLLIALFSPLAGRVIDRAGPELPLGWGLGAGRQERASGETAPGEPRPGVPAVLRTRPLLVLVYGLMLVTNITLYANVIFLPRRLRDRCSVCGCRPGRGGCDAWKRKYRASLTFHIEHSLLT